MKLKIFIPVKLKRGTDRRISAIRVVGAGKSELQPVPKSLFDSDVDVVSGDRASVDSVQADRWPAEFVFG